MVILYLLLFASDIFLYMHIFILFVLHPVDNICPTKLSNVRALLSMMVAAYLGQFY